MLQLCNDSSKSVTLSSEGIYVSTLPQQMTGHELNNNVITFSTNFLFEKHAALLLYSHRNDDVSIGGRTLISFIRRGSNWLSSHSVSTNESC